MMFRTIRSLILGLMYYRWARYMLAVGFLLFAIPITVAALEDTNIVQRSGIATQVRYFMDADTGNYAYSELMLEGSTTTYTLPHISSAEMNSRQYSLRTSFQTQK